MLTLSLFISSFVSAQCPIASFYGDDGDGNTITCLMSIDTTTSWNVTFFNNSISGVSYDWDFGDGSSITTTSTAPITHLYNTYGTFNVTLTATSANGCTDSETVIVIFEKNVVASMDFPISDVGGCVPHTVNPINNSENAVIYEWDFGDGSGIQVTNVIPAPSHTYTAQGCYTVTLTARNTCNSTVSTFGPIQVVEIDTAVFSVSEDTACVGDAIFFNNGTTPFTCSGAPNVSYEWIVDDSSFGSNIPPQVLDIGSHTAMLVSCNLCGCDTASSQILVDTMPSANININSTMTGCSPLTFSSTTSASANMLSHEWSIDGVPTYYVEDMPDHTFVNISGSTETHNIRYIGTGTCGNIDTVFTVTVFPGVNADFTPKDPEICAGESIQFSDLSTGNGLTYDWDFGNGQTATTVGPHVITYATVGTYTVSLIVNGSCGADTMTTTVIANDKPTASFTTLDTICRGTCLVMNNTTAAASFFLWDAPGATPASSSDVNPIFCYNTPGTYSITLFAFSNLTCIDTVSRTVVVQPFPFTAFSYNNVCFGDTVFFTNTSTIATSYSWNFGDGNSSTLTDPFHVYNAPGDYTVVLTGNNAFNCPSSRVHTVTVDTVPNVVIAVPDVCFGSTSFFTDSTAGNLSSWAWQFGDGDSSSVQNPLHTYADTGIYNVSLSVVTSAGCTSSGTSTATVRPGITTSVNGPANVCFGNPVLVTTSASGNIISHTIDFGDGTIVNDSAAVHTYTVTGIFNVTYVAIDDIGCSDTSQMTITIQPAISANFTYNNACLGDSVQFLDFSSGPVVGWDWDFGDGNTSTQQYPQHLYAAAGTYRALLSITSVSGCVDTLSQGVQISQTPIAAFTSDTVCAFDTTSFINTSQFCDTYLWYFGDASSDTASNPLHVYSSSANFNVTLIATNNFGCFDTVTGNAFAFPLPEAGFVNPTVCFGETSVFADTSAGAVSWIWDLGDSSSSTTQNPSNVYSAPGVYNVFHTVVNTTGCIDTTSGKAIVNALPTADFIFNPECVNQPVQFTDMSGTSAVAWYWDFGDGNVDSTQNPVHQYSAIGSYTVSLIIKPGVACFDTVVKTVNIQPEPTVTASYTPACLGDTFSFSSTGTGGLVSWMWDFGDGNTDTVQNPDHIYSGDGTFTVIVTAYNNLNCVARDTLTVQVIPFITAAMTVADACLNDTSQIFGNSNSPTASWNWDLGDGNNSSLQDPMHVYNAPGDYIVNLIVTDALGCTNSAVDTIHIGSLPVADFTPDTTCSGNPTTFYSLSSGVGALNHQWNFGGNVFSFNDTTSFTFGTSGTHSVNLSVMSSEGCVDDTTKDVVVLGGFLVSYVSDTVCLGNPTTFQNMSPVNPDSSHWDFGDGNSLSNGGMTVQNTYQSPGIYITSLEAFWAHGCADQRYNLTHVWDSVHAQFDFSTSNFCEQEFVQFTNQSTGGYLQYSWDFGDGNTSTAFAPAHLYTGVGTYTITLTATNSIGCTDTYSRTITVSPSVIADFTNTVACPGEQIQFTDISQNATNFFWDFGDNNYSSVQNPTHTYGISTSYIVTLIASSSSGCSDTMQRTITILPEVVADFSPVTSCGLDPLDFTDLSSGAPNSWIWEFGNTVSNQQAPTHTFDSTGSYSVKLIVMNSSGCVDSVIRNVSIYSIPVADFSSDTVCEGNTTSFNNMSQDENPMLFQWTFGDSSAPVYAINPNHQYNNSGSYPVRVIASNIYGCADTITNNAMVTTTVNAAFQADTACHGSNTTFQNLSSAGVGNVTWNFGDGLGQSNALSPTYKYNAPGTYNVTLTINAFSGCSSTYVDSVRVNSTPEASFTFSNPCVDQPLTFSDSIVSNGLSCAVWDFGDGSPNISGSNVTHVYNQPGNYAVQFRVCNTAGCEITVAQNLQVYPSPNADFNADEACEGTATNFTNATPNQNGISFMWNFGDGNISNVPSPKYTYAAAGTYQANLLATNGFGCSDVFNRQVTVLTNPVADFVVDTVCVGDATSFTSLNSVGITDFAWDFGDNNSTNGGSGSVNHSYANPGIYFANLTVSSTGLCTDYAAATVLVRNSVQSDFVLSDSIICLGNTIDLINTTMAGNVSQWVWDMGDGSTLNSQNVQNYPYALEGVYNLTLYAQGDFCNTSKTVDVTVIGNTNTVFAAENVCLGDVVQFDNFSSPAINYTWDFGDGSNSNATSPAHEYLNPGFYVVTLTTNSNSGCSSMFTDTMQVYPVPTSEFYPTVYETSINAQELQFIYTGIGGIDFFWDFGDGTSASGPSPTQNYVTAGNYDVGLTVWNQYGCEASSQIESIDVKEFDDDIFVPSAFSPNDDNLNDKFYIVSK
ncbi:MAG: PKD domain-containing protein, partial [Bacteroidia bacterium]|nr:PKD domain-containing protein [Bacteroidia bacterium]